MDTIDINTLLNRNNIITNITNCINYIDTNIDKSDIKKCIYIYGDYGIGKTQLINKILSQLDYNIIEYNIFSLKIKNISDFLFEYNLKKTNILNIFNNISKKNIILIDNIDTINLIDKTIISNLIKLLRPKKSKRQKLELSINNQIICIGNNNSDKKIKELMKISHIFKLNAPTNIQIKSILNKLLPDLSITYNSNLINNIIYYIDNNLRKINNILLLYNNNLLLNYFNNIFNNNIKINDIKYITNLLINNRYNFNDDLISINDTDKTTISLLYHENIIDYLNLNIINNINLYIQILNNFCFCDYMDRIIFQKQIWQLNEISFKLKVIYNNNIFHDCVKIVDTKLENIRFTKILTKYSSEFNNYIFIINLSQALNLDKKDLFLFFILIKNNLCDKNIINLLIDIYNISNLDINRIIKFLNNYIEYNNA